MEDTAGRAGETPAAEGRLPLWWACVLAVAANQLGVVLLNAHVYPLYSGVFLEARDIGSALACVAGLALYGLVATRPRLLRMRPITLTALACVLVGSPCMIAAALSGLAMPLLVASCLRTVGNAWIGTMAMLPLVALVVQRGTRPAMGAVLCGWVVCYLLEAALSFAPTTACYVVFCLMPLAVVLLSYRSTAALVARAHDSIPAADLRVTNPKSFLSLGHTVFVTLVVLKMSFGFAVTFASVDATPLYSVASCLPALVIAGLLALTARPNTGLDGFYRASMLCVLAGFLLVNPLIGEVTGMPALANTVLRAGSDLTRMLALLFAAYLGARNTMNALAVSLYLGAAGSLGSVLGAQLGIAANAVLASDPGVFALLLAGIVFAFVAYNMLAPENFRFDETAGALEAVPPAPAPASAPADVLAASLARVAAERGLTPREAEALDLLAHGRNTAAIQERMVVSRSTAKTHVRNVYAKLGVHSQQALIDLVEGTAEGGRAE